MTEHDDPRMRLTLADMQQYLIIPRARALTVWRFPVLYPRGHDAPGQGPAGPSSAPVTAVA